MKKQILWKVSVSLAAAVFGLSVQADEESLSPTTTKDKGFFVEFLSYEEYVYSQSKKTELGDQVEVDTALRYQFNDDTFARFRFLTDPQENRTDNETSKFEFLGGHTFRPLFFQIDSELNMNKEDTGGAAIGLDLDSEYTLISYNIGQGLLLTFYPFNFDGEVGREFNTWDVTRIYFIENSPSSITPTPAGEESIAEKTIPGLELKKQLSSGLAVGLGVGLATYIYPADPDFDIVSGSNPTTNRWERKEDFGYKASIFYLGDQFRFEGKYVGHTEADETGALLQSAASLYSIANVSGWILEAEVTMSKAGNRPYRLARDGEWFEEKTQYAPVYADQYFELQDWLGKTDYAYSFRFGPQLGASTPYLSFRYQGEHFIFRERESAHRLRNNDETLSHGGLMRLGLGSFFYIGDIVINPEFEYLKAENDVFSNSTDVRSDRLTADFDDQDFLLYIVVRYEFDGPQMFKP